MITAKRNSKDTVFCDLFEKPEYLLQLYKALHPEDTDATEDMLQDATIQNVLTDRIYNDLGFVVRDRLMILVEAQSTWSVNIIIRAFMYLAQSYHDRFEKRNVNLYSSKPIALPEPELYVIFTGERKEHPDVLNLSEHFFGGKQTAIDVRVKVLYGDDPTDIIGQYVRFCKVFTEQMKLHGNSDSAVIDTIRICKNQNILKAYLESHESEAVTIMMTLFNEEYIQKAYGYEQRLEGRAEGRAEGRVEGRAEGRVEGRAEGSFSERIRTIQSMKAGHFSDEDIARILRLPLPEVQDISSRYKVN